MVSSQNDTLPNEFWKHLAKFDLSEYSTPRWSILVNDMGLQCTLYWSSPNIGPPSPPASPEKDAVSTVMNTQNTVNQNTSQSEAAKTLQSILQQRLQQYNSKHSLIRNSVPLGSVQVSSRPGMKRKDSPPLPKPDLYNQVPKRMCVLPTSHQMYTPPLNTLTPSVTSSSHNSNSPNQSSQNEDDQLVIDERDDEHDDDSIEDLLKKEKSISETFNGNQPLPHIPKDLAQHIQIATKNLAQQKGLLTPTGPGTVMINGKSYQGIKMNQKTQSQQSVQNQMQQNTDIFNSAQKLLARSQENSSPFAKSVLQSWFQSQLQAQNSSFQSNNSDVKDELDSDIEEIMDGSDMENHQNYNPANFKNSKAGMCSSNSLVVAGQGQYGNSPPTGATREKMEQFIGNRGKTMDLELLRQRFSNPLARPTLTKFVYALTRLLFTDEEIIAPLRDLDQEKIDWIFDETYRMFPGCTYPTVKNAVGQVGRTKRYRAKYALGAKMIGGNHNDMEMNMSLLQGLPSLVNSLSNNAQNQFMSIQSMVSTGDDHTGED